MLCEHEADLIKPFPFHCHEMEHDFIRSLADSGKEAEAVSELFLFSSQDQCTKGQELMICV